MQPSALPSYNANKLSALLEREESPKEEQSLNTVVASPTPELRSIPGAFIDDDITTPQSVQPEPSLEEMHPSKIHQSTTKPPDSGLPLGFSDVKGKGAIAGINTTPSKPGVTSADGFEFKWGRQESDLSSEAQRIMESVREEAARIKQKMRDERDEQARKDEEADQMGGSGNRKIAKARGKAGRFSDAHKEEFKKMDSIANHGSVWKNKAAGAASLKRSPSKANLGCEPDNGRLENTAPGKRIKKAVDDDVSNGRPVSRDGPLSTIPRSLPSAITTPTKASLARSQSVKNLKSSKLPTLLHSKSTRELTSPAAKTEGANKYLLGLKKSMSMKSILHKPPPKFSDDPAKIAAGTHLPSSSASKEGDSASLAPTPARSPLKRVEFADELPIASPSPTKISGIVRQNIQPASPAKIAYPTLDKSAPLSSNPPKPGDFTFRAAKQISFANPSKSTSTIRHVRPSGIPTSLAPFESLPAVPHGMPNKKRRRADDDEGEENKELENRENHPPVQEEFEGSPAKKARLTKAFASAASPAQLREALPSPRRKLFKGRRATGMSPQKVASEGKKGGMSLSRLNFLSRPKGRN